MCSLLPLRLGRAHHPTASRRGDTTTNAGLAYRLTASSGPVRRQVRGEQRHVLPTLSSSRDSHASSPRRAAVMLPVPPRAGGLWTPPEPENLSPFKDSQELGPGQSTRTEVDPLRDTLGPLEQNPSGGSGKSTHIQGLLISSCVQLIHGEGAPGPESQWLCIGPTWHIVTHYVDRWGIF